MGLPGTALPTEGALPDIPHAVTPPSGWRSVPCASALAGDAGACTLWVEPYTADAFWSGLPSSAAADLLRLEGATDAEHDLILKAWATIVDAMEIVRWAVCWVEGRAGAGDCMEAHFEGRAWEKVKVEVVEGTHPDGDTVSMSATFDWSWAELAGVVSPWLLVLALLEGGGVITVYRGSLAWSGWMALWEDGTLPDRYCAVVQAAAVFVHEMTHVCWRSPGDEGLACEASYLVQNIFTHGLFHLHPEVTASDCCFALWRGSAGRARGPWYFGLDYSPLNVSAACGGSDGTSPSTDAEGVPYKDEDSTLDDDKPGIDAEERR